jgi:hypothetical protein
MTLRFTAFLLASLVLAAPVALAANAKEPAGLESAAQRSVAALVAAHGEAARPRAERGVRQVAKLWREEDGDAAAFEAFVQQHFAPDEARRDAMFRRLDGLHEQMDGSLLGTLLAFRWQTDLDLGPVEPYDELFAGYDPFAHVNDDFFANKIAFVVLLNFPLATLDEKLRDGPDWTPASPIATRSASRPPFRSRSRPPTPPPTATSPRTTSGCITCSTSAANGCFPPASG